MSAAHAHSLDVPRILLVDDEQDVEHLFRQRYRRELRKKQLEMYFAHNGAEALEFLERHPSVDLVVTDINMPVMDGLTLLGELKSQHPTVKSVIVSAYHDMRNIRLAMNRGAFDFLTKPIDFADFEATLDKTLAHVRQLRAALRMVRENHILRMYVDEAALAFMLRADPPEPAEVTEFIDASVAFIDICSFTALTARGEPEHVVELLNHYFNCIVADVLDHGGGVDKFIGDAVMAVFRGPDHLKDCARACLATRAHITAMQTALQEQLAFTPSVSIGINSGRALLGNIGAMCVNRYDFTVVGDMVNTAAHLQSHAPANEIFVPGALRERLLRDFVLEPRGSVQLKGRSERTELYAIRGERES
ncbi:MAG: response regulator [Myxococcales bacterium]|nr:response regulator [Myxococcales bacterium]